MKPASQQREELLGVGTSSLADHFPEQSLLGCWHRLEEHLEQLAVNSPAICLLLSTLALVTCLRYSLHTYRHCRTYRNDELLPSSFPDLTEY
jgi:hypothetical protein